jgi:uncharacterized protein (DUF1697 family)
MTTYVSILRGINVSGQRLIKMSALKELYKDLGLLNVQTYIQSGNLVFQYKHVDQHELGLTISKKILYNFGFAVPAIILKMNDLKRIIENNPYLYDQKKEIARLHVTFFSKKPERIDIEVIDQKKHAEEEFAFTEEAIYLYCPRGYGKTKLTNTFLEKTLKVEATTRNWHTVTELLKIAGKL